MKKQHLLKLGASLFLASTLVFSSCNDDDNDIEDPDTVEVDTIKTDGIVIVTETPSSSFVKYYEELPTETVDLSDGQDFQRFDVKDVFEGAMYLANPNGINGFSRVVVDNDNEITVTGTLPIISNAQTTITVSCLLYTSPSPRDKRQSRMPSSA